MRVVSWNMGCAMGEYRRAHPDAWGYLMEEMRPDVALVQEVLLTPPLLLAGRGRFFAEGAWKGTHDWGSGVWVPALPADQVASLGCEGVHAVTANVAVPNSAVLAVSLHVGTQDEQAVWLDALAATLAKMLPEKLLIVGGDFNAARHWDDYNARSLYKPFFDKMHGVGFFDCHWRLHGREVQTFWGRKTQAKYQDDHFFVNESLGAKVRECEVVDNPTVRKLSDHAPIRLEIDL